jgi:hypothetical protein
MPEYRDRHAGLAGFGVLQILVGLICVLLVLGIAAAIELTTRRGGAVPSNVAPALVLYGAAAFYFITVGTGSIRARRWARALSVAFSAAWLATGIAVVLSGLIFLQRMLVFVRPSETATVVGSTTAILVIAFIVLPLAIFLFYRSDEVRLTCETEDPLVRWTDRVPWPVLAVAVVMGFTAFAMLTSVGAPAVPFFGVVLTGAAAALTTLALAGLFGWLAVQWVLMRRSAWWTTVLLHVIAGIIAVASLARGDISAVYAKMNFAPPQQLAAMQLDRLSHNPLLWAFVVVVWCAYLAILLRVRRYFDEPLPRTRAADVGGQAPSPVHTGG